MALFSQYLGSVQYVGIGTQYTDMSWTYSVKVGISVFV